MFFVVLYFYLPTLSLYCYLPISSLYFQVFSNWFCWFVGFISGHIPFLAEIMVIMAISCYRVWMVKRPPGFRKKVKVFHVRILLLVIWVLAGLPVVYWAAKGAYSFYDPNVYTCNSSNHLPKQPTFLSTKIFSAIYVAMPMIIVFLANLRILYVLIIHSLKIGRSLMPHIKTVTTISLICWAFIGSYIPIFVRMILNSLGYRIPIWFLHFQVYCKSIHVILNPFIYVATNARFRRYIRFRVYRYTYMQPGDTNNGNSNLDINKRKLDVKNPTNT